MIGGGGTCNDVVEVSMIGAVGISGPPDDGACDAVMTEDTAAVTNAAAAIPGSDHGGFLM